jgi:hypothetical protein
MTWIDRNLRAMLFRQKAVVSAVDRTFSPALRPQAIEMLNKYTRGGPTDNAYIRLMIVELSRGDLTKVAELVELAIQDYRDLLILHRDHR